MPSILMAFNYVNDILGCCAQKANVLRWLFGNAKWRELAQASPEDQVDDTQQNNRAQEGNQ